MQIKDGYENITSDRRNYFLNEISYPRVSTILDIFDKKALVNWAAKMAVAKVDQMLDDKLSIDNMGYSFDVGFKEKMLELAVKEYIRISSEAADYGSLIHNAIETWLKGGDLKKIAKTKEEKSLIKIPLENFKQFWTAGKFELIKSEFAVVHKALKYGGRIDIIAKQDSNIVIIDIKTGKSIWKSAKIQCALYTMAFENMCNNIGFKERITIFPFKGISKIIIFHMPRIGKTKPITIEGEPFDYAKKAGLNLVNLYYNIKGVK